MCRQDVEKIQVMRRLALLNRPQNFASIPPATSPYPDSDRPPVSSAADFHPQSAADDAVTSGPDQQISSPGYKKWPQKSPSFC